MAWVLSASPTDHALTLPDSVGTMELHRKRQYGILSSADDLVNSELCCKHLAIDVPQDFMWSHSTATIMAECCQFYRLD
jgi:hypothetical protein